MIGSKPHSPALKTATCAALIAASLTVPVNADAINSIQRYCTSSWRQAGIPMQEWEDCTQETMLELLSRLPQTGIAEAIDRPASAERRELMRSIWCVAQRWRRAAHRQPISLDQVAECGKAVASEEIEVTEGLDSAIQRLKSPQREILTLWIEGNSVAEIAEQLQMGPARVSDHKYKAIKSIRKRVTTAATGSV